MPKHGATPSAYYGGITVQFTTEQSAVLKAGILADATTATIVANADDMAMADWFNAPDPSGRKCWKTVFTKDELLDCLNYTALIARSAGERETLGFMFSSGSVNPSRENVRQGLSDIFSGSTAVAINQRASLIVAMQRQMTRAEALIATGPDAQGVYTLTWEGFVSYGEAGMIVRG